MRRELQNDTILFYRDQDASPMAAMAERMEGEALFAALEGSFGNELASEVADELCALFCTGMGVTLELSGVTYMASSVMQALLDAEQAAERHGRVLLLRRMPRALYAAFEACGLNELFDLEVEDGSHES